MNLNNLIKSNSAKIISILLMFIPCVMLFGFSNFVTGQTTQFLYNSSSGDPVKVTLVLTAEYMIYSCALYFPIIIRNYKSWNVLNIIQHTCNLVVVCYLICAALGSPFATNTIPFLNMSGSTFIIIAILFSWLGQKVIAGYAWIICIVVILGNLSKTSNALGNLGGLVVLCIFMSLLVQLAIDGFGIDNLRDFGAQFFNEKTSNRLRGDITSAGSATKSAAKSAINKFM